MKSKQNKFQNIYRNLAPVYDELMNKSKYLEWGKLIKKIVKKYHIPKGGAIDLACGTGTISNILFNLNFDVTGIDNSKAMLSVAKKKNPKIKFIKQDIGKLKIRGKFNLATSLYDSLNYLTTDREMINMFKGVEKCLNKKGIFLFDVNTREHVAVFQKEGPQVCDKKNIMAIFSNSGQGNFWELKIDLFFRQKNNLYCKKTEFHKEKGYSEKDIRKLLESTSLKIVDKKKEIKYDFRNNKKYLSRIYFVLQKK